MATVLGFFLMTVTVVAQETKPAGGGNPDAPATVQRWEAEFNELAGQLGDADYPRYRQGEKAPPVLNAHSLLWETDRDPLDVVLRRTAALLADLQRLSGNRMTGYSRELAQLRRSSDQIPPAGKGTPSFSRRRKLFLAACGLRRRLALSNPLLDFKRIIYVRGEGYSGLFQTAPWEKFTHPNRAWAKEEWATFNFRDPQGEEEPRDTERFPGLFVCSGFKSETPQVKPLFAESRLRDGRHKGKILAAFPGAYQYGFDLSYDGKTVLFAKQLGKTGPYHIFKGTVDPSAPGDPSGAEIVQLTDGWFADWEPCFLPNGRIVFVSLRRWIAARCQSEFMQACGTLFSMKADGTDLRPISSHETSEFHPTVDNDGKLVYTRWDYVDRDIDAGQNLWTCYPDGSNPRAPHGNYMEERTEYDRPSAEFHIRAIPNRRGRYLAIAGCHHGSAPGVPILIDTSIRDDNGMSQVKIIRGMNLPNEWLDSGGDRKPRPEAWYVTPWPLSESYYLISKRADDGNFDICLMDKFGNTEVLVPDAGLGARPLRPRPVPPILPTGNRQGEPDDDAGHPKAVISVTNVYESNKRWPEGTQLKALRIIQIVPKPWCSTLEHRHTAGYPIDGMPRMVLGTVPIEPDGSAYFEAPVDREIYFQVLDERGMAVQSMRSGTFVRPGEHLSCVGCHEDKWKAPSLPAGPPLALRRPPSKIRPDVDGSCPLTFARLVRPVLERTCVPCHVKEGEGPQSTEFSAHKGYAYWGYQSQTIPGKFGARQSRLGQALLESHMERISEEDFHRMVLWLDANSMDLGAFHDDQAQRAGRKVWPLLGADPQNPTGVEGNAGRRPRRDTCSSVKRNGTIVAPDQLDGTTRDRRLRVFGKAEQAESVSKDMPSHHEISQQS